MVLASAVAQNDFAIAARLLAALLGTYLADPGCVLKRESACGRQFEPRFSKPGRPCRVAVSAAVATKYPTVRGVLQRMSTAPGSNLQYLSAQTLIKDFTKAATKKEKALWKHRRIMCEEAERIGVRKKLQPLYAHTADLLYACGARTRPDALCPGMS